jgi:hypothetical protein
MILAPRVKDGLFEKERIASFWWSSEHCPIGELMGNLVAVNISIDQNAPLAG